MKYKHVYYKPNRNLRHRYNEYRTNKFLLQVHSIGIYKKEKEEPSFR